MFINRNDPSLVIVPDWDDFYEWCKDSGYPECELDINDYRCMIHQRDYLEEMENYK
jgi:hypothetical protein